MTQLDLTLEKGLVRFDTGKKPRLADIESANAAREIGCWKCDSPDHFANHCPHSAAIKDLVVKRSAASRSGGRNRRNKVRAANTAQSSTSTSDTSAEPKNTAAVASLFLTGTTGTTNRWLCESGALSLMSGQRMAIRLADGMVTYSEGLGTIQFLSTCGHRV